MPGMDSGYFDAAEEGACCQYGMTVEEVFAPIPVPTLIHCSDGARAPLPMVIAPTGTVGLNDPFAQITRNCLDELIDQSNAENSVYATGLSHVDSWFSGGIPPGRLIFIAAAAGYGKTATITTILDNMIRIHDDVIVLACVIDDTQQEFISRWLAMKAQIPIDAIQQVQLRSKNPQHMAAFESAVQEFNDVTSRRMLVLGADDVTQKSREEPTSIVQIADKIRELYLDIRTRTGKRPQIVMLVDSPRDIRCADSNIESNANALVNHISGGLKNMLTMHVDVDGKPEAIQPIIFATEHLRKLPREQKRPTLYDLKDNVELSYRANAVLMLWNDMVYRVQMRKNNERSPMLFERTDLIDPRTGQNEWDAVVEITLSKSKVGRTHFGTQATALFRFYQEQSRMEEITDPDEYLTYIAQIEV